MKKWSQTIGRVIAIMMTVLFITATSAQAGDLPKYKRQRSAGWTLVGLSTSSVVVGTSLLFAGEGSASRIGSGGFWLLILSPVPGLLAGTPLLVKSRKARLRAQREATTQLHLQPLTEPSFQRESEASRSIIPSPPEPKINFSLGPGSMTVAGRF